MDLYAKFRSGLKEKKKSGLLKQERIITSAQGTEINVGGIDEPVVNFCSNNYLGLANHPLVLSAARKALEIYGFGLSSVRFICGTQTIHKQLEERLADFLGMEDCLLYTSCFDANGGLFENMLSENDAIVSAQLNHASLIDGIRLAKAARFTYREDSPEDLQHILSGVKTNGAILVVTDGVFSMEGTLAPLDKIIPLCRKYDALLVVDDSHATGFIGNHGRGTPEHFGIQVDILTGTLGKTLGGGSGGYTAGKRELITWLRNTSRPYLFSNSLPPALAAGAIAALDIISSEEGNELRRKLKENTAYFRSSMRQAGFSIPDGNHPIVPVMVGDAYVASRVANRMLELGIYVIEFSYPVVPKDTARIRVQISALHSRSQIDQAVSAFAKAGKEAGLIAKGTAPVLVKTDRGLPKTMRAWVYYNKVQPDRGHLRLERVPVSKPSPGELLLKVVGVSVCGTDEDLFHGKFSEVYDGIIPGHEIFGEIVGWGSNIRGFEIGQKIVVESHYQIPGYIEEGVIGLWGPKILTGGYLRPLNGGYAEYVAIPNYCAHLVPKTLDSSDFPPSLLEGIGNDCLIAKYLLDQGLLGIVAVVGCGPHGLFTQMFLKHFGVKHLAVFEIDRKRMELAKEFGANAVFDSLAKDIDKQVSDFTGGKGFDAVIDIAGGRETVLKTCFKYVKDRGTLVLFGLYGSEKVKLNGVPINDIIFGMRDLEVKYENKRIHVKGITGREGIWEYLIDTVAVSRELRRKIMKPVTVMGPLENLGRDTLKLNRKKVMKRAYTAFGNS